MAAMTTDTQPQNLIEQVRHMLKTEPDRHSVAIGFAGTLEEATKSRDDMAAALPDLVVSSLTSAKTKPNQHQYYITRP
jgi:hypothetical protein